MGESVKQAENNTNIRVRIQKFGRFLSGMVMPNIGAFIAWGLITALFIPTGWIPNEKLAELVGPTIKYLLPLLIGYTGGKMVYDVRGGVMGALATMGIIIGTDIPMFLGAMIMGPLGGAVIKLVDGLFKGKIPAGFEMLVNNFVAGIIGAILTILGYVAIGPVVATSTQLLGAGVEWIVHAGLLPLASIFIEPAKVLFLNNAINHGVLSPLGLKDASEIGKSIFFLLEPNPGPGLGILLAYWLFGKGSVKQSAPGAAIIHFLGGIHEIYFPYILMNPRLILSVIAGGMSGVFIFQLLDAGLVAVPSPGSIFALIALAPKGGLLAVLAGIAVSTVVSFLVSAVFLKSKSGAGEEDFAKAAEKMQELKGKKSEVVEQNVVQQKESALVKKVVFACDAGMGSSAMGASILRKKFKDANVSVEVTNTAINDIPEDADIVVTQMTLTDRAKAKAPHAEHISVDNFLNNPKYDELTKRLSEQNKG
ncbi:PTS mannitol transporter subunit IICB [Laceyella sacchari]|uniref:PTS system mannitol-specific EIICB component n=1 Tax=Laceyella sacchari TaxID=37482 RepID=A0ABY5U8W1_LACSH|nr:PTS mannitol transporter subunit IICB [Laceyella sacchari]UWE05055.1 PTS mannitol transporter subunit IICB [Laceyella sacchari]